VPAGRGDANDGGDNEEASSDAAFLDFLDAGEAADIKWSVFMLVTICVEVMREVTHPLPPLSLHHPGD
jgi:hypothetical protein